MLSKRERISHTLEAAAFEAMIKTCAYCLDQDHVSLCIFNDCPVFDNLKWAIEILQDLDIDTEKQKNEKEIKELEHCYRSIGDGIE